MDENKNLQIFTSLVSENVSPQTEKRNGFDYLSWAKCWEAFKKKCPDATYEIVKNEEGKPYYADESGIIVYTKVSVNGLTYEMWLPVMDTANRAMKLFPYEIQTKKGVFSIPAATMMDINKALMRCLVKNIAMFGLGLHVYEGEDLPLEMQKADQKNVIASADSATLLYEAGKALNSRNDDVLKDAFDRLLILVKACESISQLGQLYNTHKWAQSNSLFVDKVKERKLEIEQEAAV